MAAQPAGRLLILHHPAHYLNVKGFVPVAPSILRDLKGKGVSIYTAHVPLDLHPGLAPSPHLAAALGLKVVGPFYHIAEEREGHLGVITEIAESMEIEDLAEHIRAVLNLQSLDVLKHNELPVRRVAVAAGGGHTLPGVLERCAEAGCDTYLTGTVIERVPNERWRQSNRRFLEVAERRGINLIGASHCATERFALLALNDRLETMGIPGTFIYCADPWE